MNCQIRGLTSTRKGIGKDHIPFLVNSNSKKHWRTYPEGYSLKIMEVSKKLFLQNGRGPNQEGSKFFLIRRGPNPEGSCFHKTGGVPIRRGLIFTIPEGSQSGGVSILPIRKGPTFANPEGYCFCQPGGLLFLLRT